MVRLGECISNDQAHGIKLKPGKVLAKQHPKSLNRMEKIGSIEKTIRLDDLKVKQREKQ